MSRPAARSELEEKNENRQPVGIAKRLAYLSIVRLVDFP